MTMFFENHSFRTESCGQFIDLTADLVDTVARSRVTNGMAVVYSPHTTCAILVNECEDGLLEDLRRLLERLVPSASVYYRHDDMEVRTQNIDPEDEPNAHSHCRSALFGSTSQTIPIVDAQLMLGRWQRVFFIELDRARPRKVFMQVLGE